MRFNKIYLNLVVLIIAGVAACMITGCGSSKKVSGKIPHESIDADTPYGRMIQSYKPWETVSMGVKVRVESPFSFSISGKAYMDNGNDIHVSLRVLGFEVGVLHVNNDSAFVVDKLHKVAVTESMEKFRAYTGLDLIQLQDMLLGRWIAPDRPDGLSMRGIKYGFSIDESVDQLASIEVELSSGKKIDCRYAGWESSSIGWAPSSISTELSVSGRRYNGAVIYTPSSIAIDRHDMPEFTLPAGYKRVNVAEFFNTLKAF